MCDWRPRHPRTSERPENEASTLRKLDLFTSKAGLTCADVVSRLHIAPLGLLGGAAGSEAHLSAFWSGDWRRVEQYCLLWCSLAAV